MAVLHVLCAATDLVIFAQQFSPAQRQTEAIRQPHSLLVALSAPLRLPPLPLVAVSAPLRLPPLPRCKSLHAAAFQKEPGSVVEPVAGRTPSSSRPPPNVVVSAGARGPETGDLEIEGTAR